jgi:toxin ParE1/3/4
MAYQVSWSPDALDDVDEIAAYIQKDSIQYAHAVVNQMMTTSRTLTDNPLRARAVPELNDENYRELFIYSYRLIYWVSREEKQVLVAAVIHGSRLIPVERFTGTL